MSAAFIGTLSAIPATGAKLGARALPHTSSTPMFAHLYWSEPGFRGPSGHGIDNIWRAKLDGTGINRNFITGLNIPGDVAVKGRYLYWLDTEATTIGRAQLNGTHVDRSFLPVSGTAEVMAVDGQHIYWATGSFSGHPAVVWRADLNGSHRQKLFSIGKGIAIGGLAVGDAHIYWANTSSDTIGRAKMNGTHVKLRFITRLNSPTGLALDSRHLYWASTPGKGGSIGRVDLSGADLKPHFISGADEPFGIAIGAGYIYWANSGAGAIGRARLDGTHVQQKFIRARVLFQGSDAADPGDVAIGP